MTHIVTRFRNVPSRRIDAISSSSAASILVSSSLVHPVIGPSSQTLPNRTSD